MLFQVLDNKKECYAVFCGDELYHYPNNLALTHSWNHTPHFDSEEIEYAQIWTSGQSLEDVCPDYLREDWSSIQATGRAFLNSFHEAKINLKDVCFYDLVPKKFLLDYCSIKNKITQHVFENYERPDNYDFLLKLVKFTSDLEEKKLNIVTNSLDFSDSQTRKAYNKIHGVSHHVKYNPWGTVTGRLTVKKDSFPILTLNRGLRKAIEPRNDLFVELDFNAAEIRTLLALAGEPQPDRDIHTWLNQAVFDGKYDREQTKKKIFAWLYNPKAKNKKLSRYIDKNEVLNKYYCDGTIETPYARQLMVDETKALNYLIQSTASDIFLRSAMRVNEVLQKSKSYVAFCIHDSLVIDLHREDRHMLESILKVFSENKFGAFKVNLSVGKNFGAMRSLK